MCQCEGGTQAVSRQGEGRPRSGGRCLGAGAARDGQMKDCFDGQSFFHCGGAGGLLY